MTRLFEEWVRFQPGEGVLRDRSLGQGDWKVQAVLFFPTNKCDFNSMINMYIYELQLEPPS